MKKSFFVTTALAGCFVWFAATTDLNGKWKGVINAPDGNQYPLNYVLKIDGDKLTGTGTSQEGDVPLTNGMISGDSFSFTINVGGVDVKNTGKYYAAADSAGLDVDYQGTKMHTTLTRDTK